MLITWEILLITCLIASIRHVDSSELSVSFPANIRSERDLPICNTPQTVCSVVQKRFWLPSILYRHCRCPDRTECPSDWADATSLTKTNITSGLVPVKVGSPYSLPLTNRAQMKFCSPIDTIESCSPSQVGATYEEHNGTAVIIRNTTANTTENDPGRTSTVQTFSSTRISCQCPSSHSWIRSITGNQTDKVTQKTTYKCQPLQRCRRKQTCGIITVDTFSTYYQCLCRSGSMCVIKDRNLHAVQELHYKGNAYFGSCQHETK